MPESPEVQAFVDFLYDRVLDGRIGSVRILRPRAVKTYEPDPQVLVYADVSTVLRFGKHVDIDAGTHHLVISFGRHGWAVWHDDLGEDDDVEVDPTVIARIRFDDGTGFDVTDAGDFASASLWIVEDPLEITAIRKLGPDPADPTYTRGDLERAVSGRRKQLKALLVDQEAFAGIGNAYSDEILYAARLAPLMHAADLDTAQRNRLFDAMRDVLLTATEQRRGVPIDELKAAKVDAMRVHGRTGEPCPDCGGTIQDIGRDATTGQWCPSCQSA